MSGLLQKADLTMLEEQIQKMQNAYEYAEKTTQIIKKVQKKLRGQDGRAPSRSKTRSMSRTNARRSSAAT